MHFNGVQITHVYLIRGYSGTGLTPGSATVEYMCMCFSYILHFA